ncbi:MAG: hypothetical protein OXI79_20335 [Gammaproteobacteria bacterium]|nr:hypothetical protein [Gammaproteobacteria bacterium]
MSTRPYAHAVGPGETLVADVSNCAVPFGWTADVPAGVELGHEFSISDDPENWRAAASNAAITGDVSDVELDPVRYLRWRHTAGAAAATVRIACEGRVSWSVES